MGLDGMVGLGGFNTAVDLDSLEVIEDLNMAFFLQAEARHGRWGILFDGVYAEISGSGSPSGNLYSNADIQIQQHVEAAIASRLPEIRSAAEARLDAVRTEIRDTLRDALRDQFPPKFDGIRSSSVETPDRLAKTKPARETGIRDAWRESMDAAVDARVASLRSQVQSRVEKGLANAAFGYQFNDHWSLEVGYRHMDIDSSDGPFTLDLSEAGAFLAVGYVF